MSESSQGRAVDRRCLARRDFLLAVVGATGLLLATPAARTSVWAEFPRAPAARKQAGLAGVTLSVLQWSSFHPEIDAFFKCQVEDGFMRETGAVVTLDRISQGNVQARTVAAVEAGSGPDVIGSHQHWAHVFADHEVDLSDLAEELKQGVGEFYPAVDADVRVDGRYLALPHGQDGSVIHWRTSWFKEAGQETLPPTF